MTATALPIDIDAFSAVPLISEPFPYLMVPNFVRREAMTAINAEEGDPCSQGGVRWCSPDRARRLRCNAFGHGHFVEDGRCPDALKPVDRFDEARGVHFADEGGHGDGEERGEQGEGDGQLDRREAAGAAAAAAAGERARHRSRCVALLTGRKGAL